MLRLTTICSALFLIAACSSKLNNENTENIKSQTNKDSFNFQSVLSELQYPKIVGMVDSVYTLDSNYILLPNFEINAIRSLFYDINVSNFDLENLIPVMAVADPLTLDMKNGKIVGQSYEFHNLNEDIQGIVIGGQSTITIINENQKSERHIVENAAGIESMYLCPSEKYIMTKFGGNQGEDGSIEMNRIFNFYSVKKGKKEFSLDLGKDPYIVSFGDNNVFDGFHIVRRVQGRIEWLYIFPENKIKYTRSFLSESQLDQTMEEIGQARRQKIKSIYAILKELQFIEKSI